MTWAQASGRNFDLGQSSTPSRVSPCSYNVPRSELVKKVSQRDSKKFQPRVTYDTPDLITPGPGAYDSSINNNFPSPPKKGKGNAITYTTSRPQSSFFLSRSIRDSYKIKGAPDQMFAGFPSSADYGNLTEWGKKRAITSTPHHPRKLKKNYQKEQRCNYLDEKGRFVYVKENNCTETDIGPGYYSPEKSEKAIYQNSRKSQISSNQRSTDDNWVNVKLASTMPSPDQYDTDLPDTRLPVTIKGQYNDKKEKNDVCDSLTNPPKNNIQSKKPNSIFLSKVPRNLFEGTTRPDSLSMPGPADYGNLYDPRDQRKLQTQQRRSRIVKGLAFGSKAVRFEKTEKNTPGPADYSVILPPSRHEYSSMKATSQFIGQSDPQNEIFAKQPSSTPQNVGPGSYDVDNLKLKAQMSPAFIDGSSRMQIKDNGNPSPADYDIKFNDNIDATMINTRYEKQGDWIYQNISCAPSPESYNVSKGLDGPQYSFPRSKSPKKQKKVDIGPGSYEINTSSVIEHSFNALVPKY